MKHYRQEPIVLDGGNVVASRDKVILTDKIYRENPSVGQPRLRQRLEEVFQAKCIIIPMDEPLVGHADGVVRFIDKDHVLINDYSRIDAGYGEELRNLLEGSGLAVESMPLFEENGQCRCHARVRQAGGSSRRGDDAASHAQRFRLAGALPEFGRGGRRVELHLVDDSGQGHPLG